MARPREFNRDAALAHAMDVFWERGYAGTSTDDLVDAMGIGRQSLYNTFGNKKRLYREALAAYQQNSISGHLRRLNGPDSPLAGIEQVLVGLVTDDDELRAKGCMGVGSTVEFGTSDRRLQELRRQSGTLLIDRLTERLRDAKVRGEIDETIEPADGASFILLTMTGIQLAARGGASAAELRRMARFAIRRLKAR